MCVDKVQIIKEYLVPKNTKEVQAFLDFVDFYCYIIKDYSNIVVPLTALTCKDHQFQWNLQTNDAFDILQTLFCKAPILLHSNFQRPFIIETNACDTAIGGILSQHSNDGHLHLCAFCNSKTNQVNKTMTFRSFLIFS